MRFANILCTVALTASCLWLAACGPDSVAGPASSSSVIPIVRASVATTGSPNGTTIPAATQITDSTGQVWTLVGGVIYVNGQKAGYSGAVTLLLYQNNVIYQENAPGGWWLWTGTDWSTTSDPRKQTNFTPSPSGTTIPSATQIVDKTGGVWTVTDGVVHENGGLAGYSGGVTLLLYDNDVIYQENLHGDWWSWTAGTWLASSDPRGVPVNGSCGSSNGAAVTVAPVSNLCASGGASTVSGSGPWTWSCSGANGGATASCSATKALPPPAPPSANGTTIPSATQIVDASGNQWTLAGGAVYENGARAGASSGVTLLLYDNNIVYQETQNGAWSSWNGTAWVASSDPRIVVIPVNGACGTANGSTLTSAPTASLCSAGTSSSVVGNGPWTWSCSGTSGGNTASCSANKATAPTSTPSPSGTTIPAATQIVDSAGNVWTLTGGVIYENGGLAGFSAGVTLLLYYNNVIYQENLHNNWWSWSAATWVASADPRGTTGGGGGGGGGTGGGGGLPCTPSGSPSLVGDTNRPNNSTFVKAEQIAVTWTATGTCSGSVNLTVVDENGNSVASSSVALSNGVATYTAPSSKYGYYRVNASLADGTAPVRLGTRPAGFITYAVVPDPATRVDYGDALSRFGMQGGFDSSQGSVIPYLGIRYVLGGTPSWSALEPNGPGQLAAEVGRAQYPATAPYIDAITYGGKPWQTYEIAQFASASLPSWAGPLPGTAGTSCTSFGALNPAGVSGLPSFATALATAFPRNYPNQSKHFYQVTWEPEISWCFNGSAAQLTQYYQLVYAAIHAADPTAQVMGPTLFYHGDESLLAGMYQAGFGNVIDAFSTHPYAPWPFETSPLLADLRTEMAQANAAAGKNIPFFGTEHGLVSGQVGELNQALGNVREEIALIGEGFIHDYSFYIADFWVNSPTEPNNTYGFYWNLDPARDYGTDKLGPKPAVPAFAAMTYLLDGSTTNGPIANLSGTQMGYRFQRNGITILAIWDYQTSSTVKLPTPSGSVQVCDWMGNCSATNSTGTMTLSVGAAPIYVIGQGL